MTTNKRDETNQSNNDLVKENIQCRLSEYESRNNFLHINWQQRYVLIGINIAALSTLTSIAITHIPGSIFILFLFLASFVSSTIGLVWVAETRWAVMEMDLLQQHSMNELIRLIKDDTLFETSKKSRSYGKNKPLQHALKGRSPIATIGIFIFLVPGSICWIIALLTMLFNLPFSTISDLVLYVALALVSFVLLAYLVFNGIQVKNEYHQDINNKGIT